MKNKEEISLQNRFNTENELPQRVTEMKLQCTTAPDLFQCDHPPRGPHIAFCTKHSRWPKVTCHQEYSAQSVICCHQLRDPTNIYLRLQITPQEKVALGRGGLVVRSRLWGRRAPGSKPDSTEDPPCMGHVKSYVVVKRPPVGVAWKFGEGGASSGVVLVI
ncbi:hypothetical protein AVEN_223121-1 [Araneus ventricosus]|uniref:Uncharacterized protein n=1 Tax=Araneus ventricosus TaxID=182803 RepID=A0A4Y2EB41_ARAVE|nr:hypothetical protein AVEN_223121-1 [Araneus ventricosus]